MTRVTSMVRVSTVKSGEHERVDRLLAVQAQDLRAARLAIRARTTGLTAADVDAELEQATLVVTWLNRGTLHLVRSQDYWWLQRLTQASCQPETPDAWRRKGFRPLRPIGGWPRSRLQSPLLAR